MCGSINHVLRNCPESKLEEPEMNSKNLVQVKEGTKREGSDWLKLVKFLK